MRRRIASEGTTANVPSEQKKEFGPGHNLGRVMPRYSRVETEQHLLAIEQGSLAGMTEGQLSAQMHAKFGIGRERVRRLYARLQERWQSEDSSQRRGWRAKAMRRIERAVNLAENGIRKQKRDKRGSLILGPDGSPLLYWDVKPNLSAAMRGHELLSRIQGTQAPIEVNVNVLTSDALLGIIANLSADEVQESLQRHREDRELAEEARRRGFALAAPTENAAE